LSAILPRGPLISGDAVDRAVGWVGDEIASVVWCGRIGDVLV
jgi:hypothetical protein